MGWFTRKPKEQERLLDKLDSVLAAEPVDNGVSAYELSEESVNSESINSEFHTEVCADKKISADEKACVDENELEDIRIDFGSFTIELPDGAQVLPAVSGDICDSIFVTVENWQINIGLIAAPRSGGYWETYANKLVQDHDGEFYVVTTPHGPELITTDEETELPMRITGIDGPGWVLKITYVGRIAHDSQMRRSAQSLIDTIEVHRPDGVFLPGDVLPIDVTGLFQFLQEQGLIPDDLINGLG